MLYTIYTDGSCLKNPSGPGAAIFWDDEMIEELSGGDAVTTSNRMEITAAVVAESSALSGRWSPGSDRSA